jgi:hypothetical protein
VDAYARMAIVIALSVAMALYKPKVLVILAA